MRPLKVCYLLKTFAGNQTNSVCQASLKWLARCDMKKRFCLSWGLVLYGISCLAQTNTPAGSGPHYFFLPPIQLWAPPSEQEQAPQLSLIGETAPTSRLA